MSITQVLDKKTISGWTLPNLDRVMQRAHVKMEKTVVTESDERLVGEFKQGSMNAMEKLVARYEERIFNFGLRLCGHLQDAEDVMQDTFLSAFKSINDFRGETKLKNWLFKIASRACLKKRRKSKFAPEKELSLESLSPSGDIAGKYEIPDWSEDPHDYALRSEMKKILDEAVRSLPPKYRLVFNLRDIEGFSTEETANILDISIEAVKTRLHRARFYLRKRISEHYKEGLFDA